MEKEIKEIPFGAKDSELYKFEYTIPEGHEARIEGNKVIFVLKDSEDEMSRKWILEYLYDGLRKADEQSKDHFKAAIAYLEKQKEQKPVAPWTIQDAHPGDILNSARVQATIIFKGFNPDGKHIDAYCALQKGFFIAQELPWDRDFEPATQVWKDALFDAMVRKGYLWDAENKRLNKAEQKPAEWSEEELDKARKCLTVVWSKLDDSQYNIPERYNEKLQIDRLCLIWIKDILQKITINV